MRLFAWLIVDLLFTMSSTSSSLHIFISTKIYCSHTHWQVALQTEIYSHSQEDRATVAYFSENHEIGEFNNLNIYPIVLLLSNLSSHQSESQKLVSLSLWLSGLGNKISWSIVPLRYLMILLIVCMCDNVGSYINLLTNLHCDIYGSRIPTVSQVTCHFSCI